MPTILPDAGAATCLCCGKRRAVPLARVRPTPLRDLFCSEECGLLYATVRGAQEMVERDALHRTRKPGG